MSNPQQDQTVFEVAHFFDGQRIFLSDAQIFVHDGKIVAFASKQDQSADIANIRRDFAKARVIDCGRSIMLPGLINSHHHFYSALATGIPLRTPMPDFPAILDKLWWRLDRALGEESVVLSAQVSAADCLHFGCTTVLDHHSSPSLVRGSLDLMEQAVEPFNLATIFCFETSDRNGGKVFQESVEENLNYAESSRMKPLHRGLFGLHASFTLSDDSLRTIAKVKPASLPIHVHVAEDISDVRHAQSLGYHGPLARLNTFGLLDERSLIAHGVHLSNYELKLAEGYGLRIAHNPESNANNRVGYPPVERMRLNRLLLGTDGMNSNLLGSLHSAFLAHASHGSNAENSFTLLRDMLFANPAEYASLLFERPMGRIIPGETADFAVFPYAASTAMTAENFMAHLLYGLSHSARASYVYAHGTPVLENGSLMTVNEEQIRRDALAASKNLWEEFSNL